jgi:SAM-dependent methyltransferase
LEIGSRGPNTTEYRQNLPGCLYVGFDYYPGENVDIVGDVHQLSGYFAENEKFDIVFSSACMEHFAMPWIAAIEIAKMLKVGGTLIIETHFAYSTHSRPWHFFHFTDKGLRCLFPEALGFECIEAGMNNPITAQFAQGADEYLRGKPIGDMFCHTGLLAIKRRDVPGFSWSDVNIADLVQGENYPLTR